jgi:uncharacterized protein (DUF1810 family)
VSDPFHLQRFLDAQDPVFDQVCAELRRGRKTTHWMWFIFPQIRGLGHSAMAMEYAISSRQEAEAYLKHSLLGTRLRECVQLVNRVEGRSVEQIFGYPDHLKFHSSITLFATATADNQIFKDAMEKYFGGQLDPLTMEKL